jgi:heptosyltransferase-1
MVVVSLPPMLKKFLIVKTSAIGDIIQSFPVIEYLHKKFPGCVIDWVVEKRYADLLTSHPHINKVFLIDSYDWRKKWSRLSTFKELFAFRNKLKMDAYDAVFDLQGNTKSALITRWSKSCVKIGFGWKSVPEKLNLLVTTHRFNVPCNVNIQQRYLSLVQSYFQDKISFIPQGISLHLSPQEEDALSTFNLFSTMNIMVAFGSKWDNKQLSMATLIQFLKKIEHAYKPHFFSFMVIVKKRKRRKYSPIFSLKAVVR